MGSMKCDIVFMGSPDFALPSLHLLNEVFNVVGVVTQPDRPAGRGRKLQPPDVKILAQSLGLPIIQPATLKDSDALYQLNEWAPDVIVVAAYGQILRENILHLPPYGCINVHASLLPRWRGAAPIQAALLHDEITGVTIMKMEKGLDTGPMLAQREFLIPNDITAGETFDILAQLGADLLVKTLPEYIAGKITPQLQENENATYAPRLKKEEGKLDFFQPADFLARKVRAFNPWPGAFQFYEGIRLKIYKAHALTKPDVKPGKRYIVDDKPAWGTVEGALILDSLQAAGKKKVSGEEFLRGAIDWVNQEETRQ